MNTENIHTAHELKMTTTIEVRQMKVAEKDDDNSAHQSHECELKRLPQPLNEGRLMKEVGNDDVISANIHTAHELKR